MDEIRIIGISGSLRKASMHRGLLRASQQLAPVGATVEIAEIDEVPLYDADVNASGIPQAVRRLHDRLAGADAVILACPEYNYSISGVMKNAIDWLSRMPDQAFDAKPVAIMGASPGKLGAARAQYHLRQTLVYLNACVVNRPEIQIARAADKFDRNGDLLDENERKHVRRQIEALCDLARRVRAAQS